MGIPNSPTTKEKAMESQTSTEELEDMVSELTGVEEEEEEDADEDKESD